MKNSKPGSIEETKQNEEEKIKTILKGPKKEQITSTIHLLQKIQS